MSLISWNCRVLGSAATIQKLRELVREILKRLSTQSDAPWLCIGDYNKILFQYEKTGTQRHQWQMNDFRRALEQCDLSDLGFQGPMFTWCYRRSHPNTVWARLDRACGNVGWMARAQKGRKRKLQFRFEAKWLQSEECGVVVQEAWNIEAESDPNSCLWRKIQSCRLRLLQWNREHFSRPVHEMKELEARCVTLKQGGLCRESYAELQQVRQQLEELHARETLKWQQHSKNHWLRDGDDNTRFFHAQASTRKRQNLISGLRDDKGNWRDKEEDIQHLLSQYFWHIFTTSCPSESNMNEVLSTIQPRVIMEMNQALAQPFIADEVKMAAFGMKLSIIGELWGWWWPLKHHGYLTLLFADDTLVFYEAKVGQLEEIRRILDGYARASGQVVNFSKSSMVVSGRVRHEVKQQLAAVLGVCLAVSHEKYLGLPVVGGRSRGEMFRGLPSFKRGVGGMRRMGEDGYGSLVRGGCFTVRTAYRNGVPACDVYQRQEFGFFVRGGGNECVAVTIMANAHPAKSSTVCVASVQRCGADACEFSEA
ncbi:UNVERIFIED_CONTAM: hypothetical protein Sradi_6161700 [Sesamum radiatum]|uniref:Reverse transcriptase domain-containing protein n=1 Tax=Sesamum radiatum TaxID=300843 RepID=A0AAW2KA30_SESRA